MTQMTVTAICARKAGIDFKPDLLAYFSPEQLSALHNRAHMGVAGRVAAVEFNHKTETTDYWIALDCGCCVPYWEELLEGATDDRDNR